MKMQVCTMFIYLYFIFIFIVITVLLLLLFQEEECGKFRNKPVYGDIEDDRFLEPHRESSYGCEGKHGKQYGPGHDYGNSNYQHHDSDPPQRYEQDSYRLYNEDGVTNRGRKRRESPPGKENRRFDAFILITLLLKTRKFEVSVERLLKKTGLKSKEVLRVVHENPELFKFVGNDSIRLDPDIKVLQCTFKSRLQRQKFLLWSPYLSWIHPFQL